MVIRTAGGRIQGSGKKEDPPPNPFPASGKRGGREEDHALPCGQGRATLVQGAVVGIQGSGKRKTLLGKPGSGTRRLACPCSFVAVGMAHGVGRAGFRRLNTSLLQEDSTSHGCAASIDEQSGLSRGLRSGEAIDPVFPAAIAGIGSGIVRTIAGTLAGKEISTGRQLDDCAATNSGGG